MTRADYTALLLIVDRSGSMAPIATDMEGAIATLLEEQTALPGKLTVDYVRFDDVVEYVEKFADPRKVSIKIEPRRMTALHDAVGTAVDKFGAALAALAEDERPGTVLVAIVTDGAENASKDYTSDRVKAMIERQVQDYGWTFTYLGANQDAVLVASAMGIGAQSALTYDVHNTGAMAGSLNAFTTNLRAGNVAAYTDADREANKAGSGSTR